MKLFSWLRRIVADFFCADRDDLEHAAIGAEKELAAARNVTVRAVARAQRARLELREAMADSSADDLRIGRLVREYEEARAGAAAQVNMYREREARLSAALAKLGETERLAGINREREQLRSLVSRTESTVDDSALEALELELRAEAARLDVLEKLESGPGEPLGLGEQPARLDESDVRERARAMLSRTDLDGVWLDE